MKININLSIPKGIECKNCSHKFYRTRSKIYDCGVFIENNIFGLKGFKNKKCLNACKIQEFKNSIVDRRFD